MTEEWRPIPGLLHYEASSEGRIRVLERCLPHDYLGCVRYRHYRAAIQKQKPMPNGYWICSVNGKNTLVSRLVCMAFHGAPPTDLHEACHLNRRQPDNRPANLKWGTHKENEQDKVAHGTSPKGSRNGAAVISEDLVPEIFREFVTSKGSDVAAKFGIDKSIIFPIIRREMWAHVPIDIDLISAAQAAGAAREKRTRGLHRCR